MKLIIQKIKIINVALVVASLLVIYGIGIFISHVTTSAQCLSLGFMESKITWNFKRYCISSTGRVEPFENFKEYLPIKRGKHSGDNIRRGIQQGMVYYGQSLINAFSDTQKVFYIVVGVFRSFWKGFSGQ